MQYNNINTKVANEDDLPHFGISSKKENPLHVSPRTNIELFKNQSIDDVIIDNTDNINVDINVNVSPLMKPSNPNNTMTRQELNEDSIFAETDENDPRLKLSNKFEANNQLDNIIKNNINNNLFAIINNTQDNQNMDSSSFFQNSQSMILQHDDSNIQSVVDEYVDDDDPGFDLYECEMEFYKETCKKLSDQYDFPRRAIVKSKYKNNENLTREKEKELENEKKTTNNSQIKSIKAKDGIEEIQNKKNVKGDQLYEVEDSNQNNNNVKKNLLPSEVKFMDSGDSYYPLQYNNVIYDSFNLKVIVDRERTGFEESKEFKIVINSLVAGRYQVVAYLGSAAFSKAIKVFKYI